MDNVGSQIPRAAVSAKVRILSHLRELVDWWLGIAEEKVRRRPEYDNLSKLHGFKGLH